jgi:outer membrane protein assembly factor BamB
MGESCYKTLRRKLVCGSIVLSGAILLLGYYPAHAQLADSPWPAFLHDPQHTGRSPFVGPQEGNLQWRFTTLGDVSSSPAIGADGTVYVADAFSIRLSYYSYFSSGFLYAIKPNGILKWFSPVGSVSNSSPAIASDGTIYIVSMRGPLSLLLKTGYLVAIHPDGRIKWSHALGKFIASSSPVIADDGTIYVGSGDSYLYAFDPDGSMKWRYRTDFVISASPALDDDGNIYIGSTHLLSLNPDGTLRWSFETDPFWVASSAAIGRDGTVYVGCSMFLSDTGVLYALNPDGTLQWQFALRFHRALFSIPSPVLDSDGTIYVGDDEYIHAINPDGSLKWNYITEGMMRSSPAIDADGTVYISTARVSSSLIYNLEPERGSMYAFNNDGTLKWRYENFPGGYSSPAIGAEGTLYVGSANNHLYSIE